MGQVKIDGAMIVGPATVTDTSFPAGVTEVPFAATPNPKPAAVDTGACVRNVNSSGAFVPLTGVGTGDNVGRGDTLYIRCQNKMHLRLTFLQTPGPNLVSEIPISGTFVMEFPADEYLMLIEVKGVGLVEYFASGQQ